MTFTDEPSILWDGHFAVRIEDIVVCAAGGGEFLNGLPREAVAGMRSASEPYALFLARTASQRFSASWGLAESGAAGPAGNPYGDNAGHSCIAIAGIVEEAVTIETGSADRLANMRAFATAALELLQRRLSQ